MTDRIEIRDLRITAIHGVLPEERTRPQPFSVDLDVGLADDRFGDAERGSEASDDLAKTADYAAILEMVSADVVGRSYQLLETLADVVAGSVLSVPLVESVTVTVRKLRPPVPHDVGSVAVTVTRHR